MRGETKRLDAVLPAGGRLEGAFAQEAGVEAKALITFGGQTILGRTIQTLRNTGRVGRIVVIGPPEVQQEAARWGVEQTFSEGATGPQNILRGLEWLRQNGGTERTLIATTDLPFLTPNAIQAFLDACPKEADLAAPLVTQAAFEARFPGSGAIYESLQEGAFTLGCIFLLNPHLVLQNHARLEALFAARKSPWKMARLVGWRVAWRWVTRQLAVTDVVGRINQVLGCQGVPVWNAPAELAFDIDLPCEYAYAKAHFAAEQKGCSHG